MILADDLGIGDPGCYNRESKIATPNIDRIAREGMRFNDVHSASSVCSPTRYAILTGRYAWRTRMKSGVLQGYSRALIDQPRDRPSLRYCGTRDTRRQALANGTWAFRTTTPAGKSRSSLSTTLDRCGRADHRGIR